jgi:hypothetical protein
MSGVTHLIGFDVEATGQCMRTNFMPRFGAAVVEIATGECVDRFSTFVQAPTPQHGWEKRCVDEFWTKTPEIAEKYAEIMNALGTAPKPDEAGLAFVAWIDALVARLGSHALMFVSDTAGFDYAWISTVLPAGKSLLYAFGE